MIFEGTDYNGWCLYLCPVTIPLLFDLLLLFQEDLPFFGVVNGEVDPQKPPILTSFLPYF